MVAKRFFTSTEPLIIGKCRVSEVPNGLLACKMVNGR